MNGEKDEKRSIKGSFKLEDFNLYIKTTKGVKKLTISMRYLHNEKF